MAHNLTVVGTTVRGDGRGRALGFPTANLALSEASQRPAEGVWAAWVLLPPDSTRHKAAVHVGPVPTFNKKTPTIEVHLLDFPDHDLYDQEVHVTFVSKIADIKKMPTKEALQQRIQENCDQAREILK